MNDYSDAGFIPSSPKKEYTGTRSIRAFTIKQVKSLDIEMKPLKKDDAEITHVVLVGWIKSTRMTQAGKSFTLDDNIAQIDCTFWPNTPFDEEQTKLIEEHNLIKICGSLRVFNNNIAVSTSFLVKIDFNYVVYHFTNCIYQSLFFTNKLKREVNVKKENLMDIQTDILDVYKQNQSENGLHLDVVIRMLSSKYRENEVRDNVEILIESGNIYVVDGLEYKSTIE
ncbi:Replication factor A protein 2 [Binucleata daphniae]